MWRQDRLHALELATLAGAAAESPPSEAMMQRLLTFARYGARIDKNIGRALEVLRVLRDRPDACMDGLKKCTSKPEAESTAQIRTNELSSCTGEPKAREPENENRTTEIAARTPEPERPLNRHQRRALAAMQRRQAA
jgi:hypothetical protein